MLTSELECGDAFTWLSHLAEGSADALIADPPYASGGHHRSAKRSTGEKYCNDPKKAPIDFAGDQLDQVAFFASARLWLSLAHRALKPGGTAAIFIDWRQLPNISSAFQAAGFVWQGTAVWDKTEGVRPRNGGFRAQAEFIVWGSKGKLVQSGTYLPGVFRCSNVQNHRVHQTQKPLDLMKQVLAIVPEGGIVMDPFMGSGSTGVAALQTGRSFRGCELVPEIFATARHRIADAREACAHPVAPSNPLMDPLMGV